MSLQEKYSAVIAKINESGGREVSVSEDGGKLILSATVPSPTEKVAVWNEIKRIGGESPEDIQADIRMDSEVPTAPPVRKYTVQSGDSLSKIAKDHYGNANDYMKIFEANRDKLSDPDKIQPGQELIIP